MKIAGLWNGHDSSFCVLENGVPTIHAELERYTREKEPKGDSFELFKKVYKNHKYDSNVERPTINRFVDLGINPLYGGYRSLGRDTRIEAKDLYVPCLPIPLDTSLVMPKPTKFTPSFNCDSTCKMSS